MSCLGFVVSSPDAASVQLFSHCQSKPLRPENQVSGNAAASSRSPRPPPLQAALAVSSDCVPPVISLEHRPRPGGDLPDPGTKPTSPASSARAACQQTSTVPTLVTVSPAPSTRSLAPAQAPVPRWSLYQLSHQGSPITGPQVTSGLPVINGHFRR
ncbi:hypothetical protein CapIbe_011976 [Capra ibex]